VTIKHLGVTTVSENHIRFSIRRFIAVQFKKIYKPTNLKQNYFYYYIYVLRLKLEHKANTLK